MDLLKLYDEDLASYAFFLQNLSRELSRRLRVANGVIIDAIAGAQDLGAARKALVDALGALDRAQVTYIASCAPMSEPAPSGRMVPK